MKRPVILAACALLVLCAACQSDKQAHETADPAHHHHHTAPHGGLLVEIGEHAANLEFVLDAQSGLLTAYVLDGCAEHALRIAQPAIELSVVLPPQDGQEEPRSVEAALVAVANPLTGETAGDTSQFAAVVPELVGQRFFAAVIGDLEIRGTRTAGVEFLYLEDHAHDHHDCDHDH